MLNLISWHSQFYKPLRLNLSLFGRLVGDNLTVGFRRFYSNSSEAPDSARVPSAAFRGSTLAVLGARWVLLSHVSTLPMEAD